MNINKISFLKSLNTDYDQRPFNTITASFNTVISKTAVLSVIYLCITNTNANRVDRRDNQRKVFKMSCERKWLKQIVLSFIHTCRKNR